MLTIGELARKTGVKVPTIRYYEQMGLIDAAERSQGNQRRYGRPELERLSFIKHARQLGLTLDSISALLRLSADPEGSCSEADRIAVNAWIRGHFDAVLDFDAVVRDPARPDHLLPAYDTGDHLHLSPAGYRALAAAIPLTLFP